MAWLVGLFSGVWGKVVAGMIGGIGVFGAALAVRQSGKDAAEGKAAKQEVRDDATANRVRSDVGGLSDAELDAKLQQYRRRPF
ncbi:MAG: hypothetical protein ACJ8HI_13710 [Massilia sp.]|jgi:hypothetical protein